MKRTIHQNIWGNWYGYVGSVRAEAFASGPEETAAQAAHVWVKAGPHLSGRFTPSSGR